jgi:tetratricopeptide (TPR) repeat protein
MKSPEIFLSYSWENKKIADKIYYDLSFVGFDVIKDDQTMQYTDKISDFMKKIRQADFALLLISDSYLKSINCMTEVIQLHRDDNVWKKILPVICSDANFYELLDRIQYVNYWQKKSTAIESALTNLDPINATSLFQELKGYKEITQNIDSFLLNLKEQFNVSPEELFEKFYSPLTKKIGINPDFSKMGQIIPISFIQDPALRLKAINNFVRVTKVENSYCYSIIASCYRDLKQPEKAIQYYKRALVLDDFNYSAWNNLGQVYELAIHNYSEARKAYEKAISSKPNHDISRLNLGVLLRSHFDDAIGAKAQFEEILKFDENNAKAHNNLANIYKATAFFDLDKAEKHLIIAVNQENLEATINYANFLKVFKKNIELGNSYYKKAKELDKDNIYTEVIDILLKSEKG